MEQVRLISLCSDSPVLGGHEYVTIAIANTLAKIKGYRVHFFYSNDALKNLLDEEIEKTCLPFSTKLPLPFLRNFNYFHVRYLANMLRKLQPDLCVVAQGDIEFGVKSLLASHLAGVKTVSYIPMAYTFAEMGAKMARIRDSVDRLYYTLPDAFITISEYQRTLLSRFTDKPRYTLPNPIEFEEFDRQRKDKEGAETVDRNPKISVGVVGRVFFRQKNQIILPALVKEAERCGLRMQLHIIGDGPDLSRLKEMAAAESVANKFVFHGWKEREEVNRILSEIVDVLLIPSNFEGVPLVMLESIAKRIPFLVHDKPWAKEYEVPSENRFMLGELTDLVRNIERVYSNGWSNNLELLREHVLKSHSNVEFTRNIKKILDHLVG